MRKKYQKNSTAFRGATEKVSGRVKISSSGMSTLMPKVQFHYICLHYLKRKTRNQESGMINIDVVLEAYLLLSLDANPKDSDVYLLRKLADVAINAKEGRDCMISWRNL